MSQTTITAVQLKGAEKAERVLVVGAGLGTGVQALWQLAADQLGPETAVIGYDLPGHGVSAPTDQPLSIADLAQAVTAVVKHHQEQGAIPAGVPVYYAGVSLNGEVALQIALEHSDVFAGVAVICSAAKIGEPQAWKERAELVERAGTPTQVEGSSQRWFAPGFLESHPERATALLHTLQDADRHSYARLCEALAGFDVRDRLGEITVPVLCIHGVDDAVTPPSAGEEIAAGVKETTTVVLDDVAHQAPLEDPESVVAALTDFMAR